MIHETAIINQPATIGKNLDAMEYVVIGTDPVKYVRKNLGYKREPPTFGVTIGNNVTIHGGSQIIKGVEHDTIIGDDVVIGQRNIIGHDCNIGRGAHLLTSITLTGHVEIGTRAVLGAGTVVKQRTKIGAGSFIGMGSIVTKDIPPNVVAYNTCVDGKVYCRPMGEAREGWKNWIRTNLI